jgi:serine/threonine protein kinase
MTAEPKRGILIRLAIHGLIPVVGGCAGVAVGGAAGGIVGVAVGEVVEKAVKFFGNRIVETWADWFAKQPPEVREKALLELAATPPEEVRAEANHLLLEKLPDASPADRELALSYLTLLPGAVDRVLTRMPDGGRSVPATITFAAPNLMGMMPLHLPPFHIGQELPQTPYRLDAVVGSGGFGVVYRASLRSLQHLPLAVKFCLDPAMAQTLNRERGLLERLMRAGGESWSPRVVRLYGYDLEYTTPYLVYEYVTGGDLLQYLNERRYTLGRELTPDEILDLIVQITEALAFVHSKGLVHRDLKPANILVESDVLKLADFGLGGVTADSVMNTRANHVETMATMFRGAGTPLYMAPEQRRGQPPDPRHDLFSLGVLWYQLLVGDLTRELHPGWTKELLHHGVPSGHINVLERCVGWCADRPSDANALLPLLTELRHPTPAASPAVAEPPPAPPLNDLRRYLLGNLLRDLSQKYQKREQLQASKDDWIQHGLTAGGLVGAITFFSVRGSNWVLIGFLAAMTALLVSGFIWVVSSSKRKEHDEALERLIEQLRTEFPDQIRDWGGVALLHDPLSVTRLERQFSATPEVP